ncbi:diacylglycerol kinase, partial [Neisseria meningitidis]
MEPSSYAAEKKGKGGIRRVINAFGYSIDGIAAAYRYEAAFRQVLWLNVLLV